MRSGPKTGVKHPGERQVEGGPHTDRQRMDTEGGVMSEIPIQTEGGRTPEKSGGVRPFFMKDR